MLTQNELGAALGELRELVGLSTDECSARIGVAAQDLQRVEQGHLDMSVIEQLAQLYGLDVDDLSDGAFRASEDTRGATVFLLQGAYQEFDAGDIATLSRAILAARYMTSLGGSEGAALLRTRLELVPTPAAGPWRADAARQGYLLAREVRRKLALEGEPLADIGELLEERLGIAVVVESLKSPHLRAASIVDAGRAAAAAVLGAADPEREANPALARVYLAHELCHILFDPAAPGMVRLALDDRLDTRRSRGRGSFGSSQDALLESRAKGFAAEFLLPHQGLVQLLGTPADTCVLAEARTMIQRAREHFGTPQEIAANHLENLGFVSKDLRLELGRLPAPPAPATRLPGMSKPPIRLERLSAHGLTMTKNAVLEARNMAAQVVSEIGSDVLGSALAAVGRNRPLEATDKLVDLFDGLLASGQLKAASRILEELDPSKFPPGVLTGVLAVTLPAKTELGEARTKYFDRVRVALAATWQLPQDRIEAIEKRLR
ncbi:MAG: XRE family transcriptional regulator [Deltaproteobacteria bacterium]|nr:XRE family transcriptional regulator [Deltaproteobacteria bacterium]